MPRKPRLTPPQLSALEHLIARLNDKSVDDATRDKIAIACLPYTAAKTDLRVGLKAQRQAAAVRVGSICLPSRVPTTKQ